VCAGINLPCGFELENSASGHLCYEEIIKGDQSPVVFEDLSATIYKKVDPVVKKYKLRAYLGAPVSLDGKVRGALCVVDYRPRKFSETDVNILVTLARALSLEEERLETEKALKKKATLERMLTQISSCAIRFQNQFDFLQECLTIMGKSLNVGGVFAWEYNAGGAALSNVAEWLSEGMQSQKSRLQNIPEKEVAWGLDLLWRNKVINYENIEDCPDGREKEIMRALGLASVLVVPIFIKEKPFGFIGFETYQEPRKWTDEEIYVLRTAALIIAKAIESKLAEDALVQANLQLEERVRKRTEKLENTTFQLKERQKDLLQNAQQLENVNRELLDMNKAVTVLARNIEARKKEVEFRINRLVRSKIAPIISKLISDKRLHKGKYDLELVLNYLCELTSDSSGFRDQFLNLTETEARIAGMIRSGLTSEAVAKALNISLNTVKTHRRNIRKKLEVQNKSINLKNFLKTEFQNSGVDI
jgi:GAF domain-containing protein